LAASGACIRATVSGGPNKANSRDLRTKESVALAWGDRDSVVPQENDCYVTPTDEPGPAPEWT